MKRSPIRGFTLLEVMVAVALCGVLAALAGVSYDAVRGRSKRSVARSTLAAIVVKQEAYYGERNEYAANLDQLGLAILGAVRISATAVQVGSYLVEMDNSDTSTFYAAATANLDGDAFLDVVAADPWNMPTTVYDDVMNSYSPLPNEPSEGDSDEGSGGGGGDTGGGSGGSGGGGGKGGGNGGGNGGGGNK